MKVIVPTKFNYEEGSYARNSIATYYNFEGVLSTAPPNELRINYDPNTLKCVGSLLELSSTNRILYSEDYNNPAWSRTGINLQSGVLSPDAVFSSFKLIETGNGEHSIAQTISGTFSGVYSFSNFVKSSERSKIKLEIVGIGYCIYDLTTKTVTNSSGITDPAITTIRNGWIRLGFSVDLLTSNIQYKISLVNDIGLTNYSATTNNGLSLFGSQIELGKITSYIKTISTVNTRAEDICSGNVAGIYYSNIEETEYSFWNSGTLYAIGDKVIYDHIIYNCIQNNSNNNPETSITSVSPVWEYVKPTNRWAMFDLYTNRSTSTSF
jgi:hypothetical protein